MTIETVSQWSIVFLVLVIAIFAITFHVMRRDRRRIDAKFAARFYSAYLGETFRLAGYDAENFLKHQDLRDPRRVMDIYCVAEAALLASIEHSLTRQGDPMRQEGASSPVTMNLAEYDQLWRRRAEPAEPEVDDKNEEAAKFKGGLKKYAMILLRKINPVVQQLAGSWIGGKPGMPG